MPDEGEHAYVVEKLPDGFSRHLCPTTSSALDGMAVASLGVWRDRECKRHEIVLRVHGEKLEQLVASVMQKDGRVMSFGGAALEVFCNATYREA